jgi:hypothetical protein
MKPVRKSLLVMMLLFGTIGNAGWAYAQVAAPDRTLLKTYLKQGAALEGPFHQIFDPTPILCNVALSSRCTVKVQISLRTDEDILTSDFVRTRAFLGATLDAPVGQPGMKDLGWFKYEGPSSSHTLFLTRVTPGPHTVHIDGSAPSGGALLGSLQGLFTVVIDVYLEPDTFLSK